MTQSTSSEVIENSEISEQDVVGFLKKYPNFLFDKPKLLAEMNLPHPERGSAVSIIEHQVSVLRSHNEYINESLYDLVQAARINDRLFIQSSQLILALMDAGDFEECLQNLFFSLDEDFQVEFSHMMLLNTAEITFPNISHKKTTQVDQQLAMKVLYNFAFQRRAYCGELSSSQKQFLFKDCADQIQSSVLTPLLYNQSCLGFMAIASSDPDYYQESMSTLFVEFIADVLVRCLVQSIAR